MQHIDLLWVFKTDFFFYLVYGMLTESSRLNSGTKMALQHAVLYDNYRLYRSHQETLVSCILSLLLFMVAVKVVLPASIALAIYPWIVVAIMTFGNEMRRLVTINSVLETSIR